MPCDDENLLLQAALKLASNIPPHRLKMTSEILLSRGLGLFSSVIIAEIELVNQLGQLTLSDERKLEIATEMQGHLDNVALTILGQMVISSQLRG
ncbi:GHMP family kinase ATP-binding protein [Streptococcus canis]|uniref:GHMP family kinase ATP-binding protein n=1 Tax=Streptococcus canis TaxID=1329 RepID=UPI0010CA6073|nr:hypothetical protein [Streptococcus canis]VTR79912.1 homoserine kinase [Streptococcus canis]